MGAHLTGLNVFPLKSGRGTSLEVADLGAKGLRHDREFMLITPDGEFLSQRRFPRMALLRPSYDGALLTVRAPSASAPLIHKAVDNGTIFDVTVQRKPCKGVDQGDEAAGWFSDVLGLECRLVRFSGYRPTRLGGGELAYADGFPLLLISAESLADLNSRLAGPLPMNRFRPNLVVEGLGPFGEDSLRLLRIGDVVIELVKPCTRCVLTTVDQDTAVKGHEPLRTLASFRNIDGKILFGQNGIPRTLGTLRVGDPVEVLERIDGS
ncbi:MAG: domain containing protein [Actinomycetia bacterium]|nr:domain containing protein [Actinomycetes bacterium]